jgi:hypothetical protein
MEEEEEEDLSLKSFLASLCCRTAKPFATGGGARYLNYNSVY